MARPVWSGSISFGLVNIPVQLFTATEDRTISFHQYERGTGARIHHRRVADGSSEEVPYHDIVKGYPLPDGTTVLVEPDELEAIAPGQNRAVEIEDFVDLADVDPIYFRSTYYVAPAGDQAVRPYELLRRSMEDARRVGIARFVMRAKQHLAAVRPADGALVLETMYFADEVRDRAGIDELGRLDDAEEPSERELRVARDLVESLTADWDPTAYRDTYRDEVRALIERKANGEEVEAAPPPPSAEVIDLVSALERSVDQAGRRHGVDDLAALSKDELYERAQARDIGGRSSMSKDELVEALRRAS